MVATGRLRCRTWEDQDGNKRVTVEMTVDDLGPSLRRAVVKVTKATREHPPATEATGPAPAASSNGTRATADPWDTRAAGPVPAGAAAGAAAGTADDKPPF